MNFFAYLSNGYRLPTDWSSMLCYWSALYIAIGAVVSLHFLSAINRAFLITYVASVGFIISWLYLSLKFAPQEWAYYRYFGMYYNIFSISFLAVPSFLTSFLILYPKSDVSRLRERCALFFTILVGAFFALAYPNIS